MLYIKCPYCGLRNETEFSCGGESHIVRPNNNNNLSNKEWAEFLFSRHNPKGVFLERWVHSSGCRKWFNIVRNTLTNEIYEVYEMGNKPKSSVGKKAYKNSWRRLTKAEMISVRKNVKK